MWLCRSYRPGIGVCLVGFVDALVECSMQEKFLSWQVLPLRPKPQNIFNMFCSSRRRVQHLIRLMSLDPSKEWVCMGMHTKVTTAREGFHQEQSNHVKAHSFDS